MPHLQTFARLHVAGTHDVNMLAELEASLHGEAGAADRNWPADAASRDSHIVLAMECQAAVGAAEVVHAASDPVATLVWLGVAHSARGRGIGQLLIESAVEHARGEGAAVLRLGAMALSSSAINLLAASGFVERNYDATHVVFEKSLWDERTARQNRPFSPHFYGSLFPHGSPAAALMVAMATIDSRFMMTAQVERVITAEIAPDAGSDAGALVGIASAAAHRAFNVVVHGALSPLRSQRRAIGDGIITASAEIPTAEQLIGLLSLRQVPLLRCGFDRLHTGGSGDEWLVVLGFDGLLFQLFDPRRPDQRDQAATLGEMRAALTAEHAACLVISRH